VWLCGSIRSFVLHVLLCGEACRHASPPLYIFRYRVYNSRKLDPFPGQINPVHNFQNHFCKMDVKTNRPSKSRCSRLSLSFSFSHQKPVCISPHPTSATCSVHLVLLDLTMPIIHLLRSASHGALHCEIITVGRLCPSKFFSTLFPKPSANVIILARQSKFNSNTYNIIVLYILIINIFSSLCGITQTPNRIVADNFDLLAFIQYILSLLNLHTHTHVERTKVTLKSSRNRHSVAQRIPGCLGSQIFMTFGT
jgi:hypothetical protein